MIQIPVQFTKVNLLADRSVSILLHTSNEINNDDLIEMLDHRGMTGWVVFKEDAEPSIDEIPKEDSGMEKKSQGQRMRSILYRIHEQSGSKGDFNSYYESQMEMLNSKLKEKLL